MTTQEILGKLEKNDKVVIRNRLKGIYSESYITALIAGNRKATKLFNKIVQSHWENMKELESEVGVL